ncbi:hypothetical protein ACEPAI_9620 [Sanghuangporus weigelae]
MSSFKAGGFTFTNEQLVKLGTKFYKFDEKKDKSKMNEMNGISALIDLIEENRIGFLQGIVIPKGVDVPGAIKRDGFYRGYFLGVFYKPLSDEETIDKFEPISFDPNDADIRKILDLLEGHGYMEEMEGRWRTFSDWSFGEHIEHEVHG